MTTAVLPIEVSRISMLRLQPFLTSILLLGVLGCGPRDFGNAMSGDDYMEYDGQRFETSKSYSDWDDFKEDPNNYPESETERMQAAVKSVEFLPSVADRETVMAQMSDKQFPGFGCTQLGILHKHQLDQCAGFSIQIPRSDQCRHIGYVNVDGRFVLVSDFIGPPVPTIAYISVSDDNLNFHSIKKSVVHRDPIGLEDEAEQ